MSQPYYSLSDYTPRRSVGYLIRHASKLITSEFETRFKEQDVNFLQWTLLMHLSGGLATTAAELCHSTAHDSGALTRVLDQLEQRGLITRSRSQTDRRVVDLALTDEGKKTCDALLPLILDFYNTMLSDFTHAEADQLVSLLSRFVAALSEAGGQDKAEKGEK